ncbi:MAG TPA: ribonuclease HI family protein [Candidatus Dormibacteraeota bacterium]|nr:ribonuclease HI family protein [Candidatus Dormibacteraeota bacterium]
MGTFHFAGLLPRVAVEERCAFRRLDALLMKSCLRTSSRSLADYSQLRANALGRRVSASRRRGSIARQVVAEVFPYSRAMHSDAATSTTPRTAIIHADGGSRGNPGPAAIGAVVAETDGRVVQEVSAYIGRATNNVAEYRALIEGLRAALELHFEAVRVRMDSELIVRQLLGEYRVKNEGLRPLYEEARRLLARFASVDLQHVPRSLNREADALVNRALDARA